MASVAASLLAVSALPSAASGCPFSSLKGTQASGHTPGGWWTDSPDSRALGSALGGLGAIAALLAGGTVLMRQRWLAQAAAANASALDAEASFGPAADATNLV
ncbi:MAG: hypothetical protein WBG38_09410, partial [Nodosilinea sp.]